MYNRKKKLIILAIVLLLIVALTILSIWDYNRYKNDIDNYTPSQNEQNVVYYEGEPYKYNQRLKNILFLGIDNDSEISDRHMTGAGGQADCIMLLTIDMENKTMKLMQIPRDSMTDIDLYDDNGNYYTSIKGQVALQYAYTNSAKNSCWATKKTVSELLYNLPIDGYIAVDIGAMSKLNELLGGITMTMEEDYTNVDPAFIKGETLTFTGEQAERFVRYRDTNISGSSHERMQRQVQFIPAFMESFQQKIGKDDNKLKELYSGISPYMETNMSINDIEEIMTYSDEIEEYIFPEGEIVQGEEFEEFYLDEQKLKNIIIKMFYKKI